MGRATRWLKGLLGMKNNSNSNKENENQNPKINPSPTTSINVENNNNNKKEKRRWSFAKSSKDDGGGGAASALRQIPVNNMDGTTGVDRDRSGAWLRGREVDCSEKEQSKHAIAVAAATAAAADAAVAAAQAAFAVVRLTSRGRGALFQGEKLAALKIQTVFRGYLARRAHRALKALVKLQAHVRGYLVRKRATATLRRMQALFRAQAAARSQRVRRGFTKDIRLPPEYRHRRSLERFDETRSSSMMEHHSQRLSYDHPSPYEYTHDNSPKIVEIDTFFKPRTRSRRLNNPSSEDVGNYPTISSPLPCPAPSRLSIPENSRNDYDWGFYYDHECRISTAHSTPRFAKSFRTSDAPSTPPARSVCGGDTYYMRKRQQQPPLQPPQYGIESHDYYCFPNYMTNTQSFRAKVRSQSAPRQRPEVCPSPKKRLSLNEIMASRNSISSVRMHRCASNVQEGSTNF